MKCVEVVVVVISYLGTNEKRQGSDDPETEFEVVFHPNVSCKSAQDVNISNSVL